MSLKKSTIRRVALFTSSSLVAAGLAALGSLGSALVPSAALAQSVCAPTPSSGAGTNEVEYTGAGAGIVCSATGSFTLNATAGIFGNFSGPALAISSTGATTVNVTGGATIGGPTTANSMPNGTGRLDFSGAAGGVTLNLQGATNTTGRWQASGASIFSAANDTINYEGVGYNFLGGRAAQAQASIDLGAGDDTINLAAFLAMGGYTQDAGSIDFGDGNDVFNIGGVLTAHGGELENLEALNLSGTILMGSATSGVNPANALIVWTATDGVANDILRLNGATFTGSGNARVVMDVAMGEGQQAGCATSTGAGDCLDLRGGSTAGVTALVINNAGAGALPGGSDLVGITVVDVGGGTSAAGHFVLAPTTPGFTSDAILGDVIGRPGLFAYALRYDEASQRHFLVGLPRGEVMGYAMLSGAAQSVWHMTADTVTDRQTQLRDGTDDTGLWLRTSGEYSKRRSTSSFQGVGETYTVDTSYKLYAGTVTGGMDLISGSSGEADYVLGAQIGYVSSSFDLDEAESSGRMTGGTGGVYASVWSDWFFVDGAVNFNGLTLDHEAPALGARTNTYLNSIGARLDAGTRTGLGDSAFVEPLAAVSWVRTSFEEISVFGGQIQPADTESLRAGLGLRLGATLPGESVSASYFVTGRGWYEFEGETSGVVRNPGADLPFADEFTGAFGEAEAGVNVFNAANTLSAFASTGVKWQDGYSAVNLSLGVRMAW